MGTISNHILDDDRLLDEIRVPGDADATEIVAGWRRYIATQCGDVLEVGSPMSSKVFPLDRRTVDDA
jgi:hypothetical protein